MPEYKRVETKHGRTMWFVNGHMTSANQIPMDVVRDLQSEGTLKVEDEEDENVQTTPPEEEKPKTVEPPKRECLVCGEPGTHSKFVAGVTVYLCDEHYGDMTTGEVVQLMRSKNIIN